jgi:hypothetical protein
MTIGLRLTDERRCNVGRVCQINAKMMLGSLDNELQDKNDKYENTMTMMITMMMMMMMTLFVMVTVTRMMMIHVFATCLRQHAPS